jgi:hypothetical protein
VADIAASAARQAAETGVDPRDVAAALYMTAPGPAPRSDAGAVRRRALRAQIAALEQALGELQAKHPQIAPPLSEATPDVRPRLLSLRELERQRTSLVRALAAAQAEIDSLKRPSAEAEGSSETAPAKRASKSASTPTRPARVRPSGRVAPAGT